MHRHANWLPEQNPFPAKPRAVGLRPGSPYEDVEDLPAQSDGVCRR
jgi:hypothetical protein